jgi:hypothetical protein
VHETVPDTWYAWTPTSKVWYAAEATSGAELSYTFINSKKVSVEACKLEDKNADPSLNPDGDRVAVEDWEVKLSVEGEIVDTRMTGPDGCYKWENLDPGISYDVHETVPDTWYAWTPTSKVWYAAEATSGAELSYTFINSEYVTKSGLKWHDYNLNGERDDLVGQPGILEPFMPGWYVQLWVYDPVTELPVSFVGRGMTDEFGVYTFEGIMPGYDYIVCEELPEFWVQSYPTLATLPPEGEGVAACPATGDGGFPLGPVGWTFEAKSGDEFLDNDFGNWRPIGCTRTQGYWKTHSKYGPAGPYDETWLLIEPDGEDTPFFGNDVSWYEIMWMPPKGGNAYIILAHQYIAAQLNFLAGADPSAVFTEFGEATTLLSTYTWDHDWSLDPDTLRQQFIMLAGILDDYNNGYIGPGHCVDE